MRPVHVLFMAILILSIGCTGQDTPEHAAEEIVAALQAGDRLRLESYVDADRLAEDLVDQKSVDRVGQVRGEDALTPRGERELYLEVGLGRSAEIEMTRVRIREALDRLGDAAPNPSDRAIIDGLQLGSVRQAGRSAEAEVFVSRPGTDERVRLTARLERSGGAWRLVGLHGLNPGADVMQPGDVPD